MKKIVLFLIRTYQMFFSPDKGIFRQFWLVAIPCRFPETCSDFAYRQVKEKGVLEGLKLASKRIASCHPITNK